MIGRIIETSVHNRFFVLLMAGIAVLVGWWALTETPVDAIPDLSDVQVIVYTEFPGQAPQVVEDQVTYPLSTAMLSVPYAKNVRGYSFFGFSMVYVIFEDGTDLYWARSRVLEYLNVVQGRLPGELGVDDDLDIGEVRDGVDRRLPQHPPTQHRDQDGDQQHEHPIPDAALDDAGDHQCSPFASGTCSRNMLHSGQRPGSSEITAGCIGQVYCPGCASCGLWTAASSSGVPVRSSRNMPHSGQRPSDSEITSGCIGQDHRVSWS